MPSQFEFIQENRQNLTMFAAFIFIDFLRTNLKNEINVADGDVLLGRPGPLRKSVVENRWVGTKQ